MKLGTKTTIALADGSISYGRCFGFQEALTTPVVGELVFNTSMYGYQEILTDPSYAGQIVTFSYPHIGNVGCNEFDNESDRVHVQAFLCRNLPTLPSNYRAQESLEQFLVRMRKVGVAQLDTRSLVMKLRDGGAQMAAIALSDCVQVDALIDAAQSAGSMVGKEYVSHVSCKKRYEISPREGVAPRYTLACIDCGIKKTMLELLAAQGCRLIVFPYDTAPQDIECCNPDALFFSNGPGDPAALPNVVATAHYFLRKKPLFGICLGHQIIAQALGATTYKLSFGHRGANHPVLNCSTGKVDITVQNHGFAVDERSLLATGATISHINLNDKTVEGLVDPARHVMSVQYHPESSPGPHDARSFFEEMFSMIAAHAHSETRRLSATK